MNPYKPRGVDWEVLAVLGILVCFLGACVASAYAVDWDWRCLFVQCRVLK